MSQHRHFTVVGIGGSAGAPAALADLLQFMPHDSGMAFVAMLRPAEPGDQVLSLLQAATHMPVVAVTGGSIRIRPDHVYLAPADRQLSMADGCLVAGEARQPGDATAIDLFFITLAETWRDRAIAIVLSGDDHDGAVGIGRIKRIEGTVLVQEPADAEYPELPRAAIASGSTHAVMPVCAMAQHLLALAQETVALAALLRAGCVATNRFHNPGVPTAQALQVANEELRAMNEALRLEAERLAASKRDAENASRLREEFLAVLSHELKQPLNLINLNAELLKRLPESRNLPSVAMIADTISGTAVSQAQIIDDLLDLSRVRTGKLRLYRSMVNVATIVERICESFGPAVAAKNLSLSVRGTETPTMVDGDGTRIEQIVANLLGNAVKFTPDGGVIVVSVAAEDGMACLRVADSGKGIAEDFLPHVFEMFQQAEAGGIASGLGIGLALVQQLAQSHGGSAQASSGGPGRGAQFCVRLPLASNDVTAAMAACDLDDYAVLRGLRLLLVDDEKQTLNSFAALLKCCGAEICCAANAAEALECVREQGFDFVVTDLAMPGIDGFALLEGICALPAGANLPVIAVTALGRPADIDRALEAGFAAHLTKPIALEKFVGTITALLEENGD